MLVGTFLADYDDYPPEPRRMRAGEDDRKPLEVSYQANIKSSWWCNSATAEQQDGYMGNVNSLTAKHKNNRN